MVWSSIGERARRDGIPVSLRHLCDACVAELPVDGAAVVLTTSMGTREIAYATDTLGEDLVELQNTCGEGPAPDAAAGFDPVLAGDLNAMSALARWPLFVPDAIGIGARAEFALPLRLGAVRLGALDLHRTTPGDLPADALADAASYADAAMAIVLNARAGADQRFAGAEKEYTHRGAELHQAAGMVSVQLGVPVSEAMDRLRAHAYGHGVRLRTVAESVVQRRLRFSPADTSSWEELS